MSNRATTEQRAAFPFSNFEDIPGGIRYGAGDLTYPTIASTPSRR